MTVSPEKFLASERVFELKPLADEVLPIPQRSQTLWISCTELARMRQHPLASEEFDSDPNAPTLYAIGRTSDGSLLARLVSHGPAAKSSI